MAVQKTALPTQEQINKKFYLVNADGKTLGRLSARIAAILRGKNKAAFTPFMETGDSVIVVNAEKIRVTGKKMTDKVYDRYTGFHSGLKGVKLQDMLAKRPNKVLELAIHRMIPKGKLGICLKNNLFIYSGSEHPHKAQKPVVLDI
ncbi:MAG: 50S ribosomal protein L13 [Candidatus Omnitrophica bacterium]|nr:50S ribosomal protein L13 [Candidatus Omnitrophota bacterium]